MRSQYSVRTVGAAQAFYGYGIGSPDAPRLPGTQTEIPHPYAGRPPFHMLTLLPWAKVWGDGANCTFQWVKIARDLQSTWHLASMVFGRNPETLQYRLGAKCKWLIANCFFHFFSSRFWAALSSTPLIKCTDSGLENLRAISSASLITTGLGVSG